jgi:hypothetical protein
MSRKRKRDRNERELTISVDPATTGSMSTTAPVAFAVPGGPLDLLNRPVDPLHRDVLDLYLRTKALCERKDLPPYAARNLRKSLASLYQVVNDAGIVFEHLYDVGV